MPTFEDILKEVQRQESENTNYQSGTQSYGIGAPLSAAGDFLRTITNIKLDRKRKMLEGKVLENAQKKEEFEGNLHDTQLKIEKDRLIEMDEKVGKQKQTSSLSKIRDAEVKSRAFKDPSYLSNLDDETIKDAQVLKDPLTGSYKTYRDIYPNISEALKQPKYSHIAPSIELDLDNIYSGVDSKEVKDRWSKAFQSSEKMQEQIDFHNNPRPGKQGDPAKAFTALTGKIKSTQSSIYKISDDIGLDDDEKIKRKRNALVLLKSGPVQEARASFTKVGATDQLQKLDQIESSLDDSIENVSADKDEGLDQIFSALSGLTGKEAVKGQAQKASDLTKNPKNASVEKKKEAPVTVGDLSVSKSKVPKGMQVRPSKPNETARDYAQYLKGLGLSKQDGKKYISQYFPEYK